MGCGHGNVNQARLEELTGIISRTVTVEQIYCRFLCIRYAKWGQ